MQNRQKFLKIDQKYTKASVKIFNTQSTAMFNVVLPTYPRKKNILLIMCQSWVQRKKKSKAFFEKIFGTDSAALQAEAREVSKTDVSKSSGKLHWEFCCVDAQVKFPIPAFTLPPCTNLRKICWRKSNKKVSRIFLEVSCNRIRTGSQRWGFWGPSPRLKKSVAKFFKTEKWGEGNARLWL